MNSSPGRIVKPDFTKQKKEQPTLQISCRIPAAAVFALLISLIIVTVTRHVFNLNTISFAVIPNCRLGSVPKLFTFSLVFFPF